MTTEHTIRVNELATRDELEISREASQELIASMQENSNSVYSSIQGDSFEDRVAVVAAITDAEPIADHLGQTIWLKDIVAHSVTITDDETGEVSVQPRTILIDKDGKAYSAVSGVIVNRLTTIVNVIGQPHTWPSPLPIRVTREKASGARTFFEVRIVTGAKPK